MKQEAKDSRAEYLRVKKLAQKEYSIVSNSIIKAIQPWLNRFCFAVLRQVFKSP